ncbi:MAG: molybdopterin-dependent oxidoreductase [Candidatus Eisenbacteria bacterium]|nr:molybdopterin-dependent oxidoreductase [Candidatus Eisenbacteria bacterium]
MSDRKNSVVGRNLWKVDGIDLVTGAPVYTDDFFEEGMLYGKILRSPHAHARIRSIDVSAAREMEGVHAVLCHENVVANPDPDRPDLFERIPYTSAGQDFPEPSPLDIFLFDRKVRYVGDRVAAVAAESEEIAAEALRRIRVDYEVLPPVFTVEDALREGAPVIHDEKDSTGAEDASRNRIGSIDVQLGDTEAGFAEADLVVEGTYQTQRMQHAQMELHVAIATFDGDGRLVLISSNQVPFHVRRHLARVLGLSIGRVRVIKPRIGGGFGGKQGMMVEEVAGALALASGQPVRVITNRFEDLNMVRVRHPMTVTAKVGIRGKERITAMEIDAKVDGGAYGAHSTTVPTNTGNKNLPRYRCANVRFRYVSAYTNLVPGGAMRGYGTTQGAFALESEMDEAAEKLGIDPVELRLRTTVREGDTDEVSPHMYEAKIEAAEPKGWPIHSCGLPQCLERGAEQFRWKERREAYAKHNAANPVVRKGVGMCCLSQGSGVASIDSANATVKMNEDGSVTLFTGAADLGTGADTVIAQIVAETLGIDLDEVTVYSGDTDLVPFDSGAYASSTSYISGGAALKAAQMVRDDLLALSADLIGEPAEDLELKDHKMVSRKTGRSVPIRDAATHVVYKKKVMISRTASHTSPVSPPPFAAVFADVEVDTETGEVRVKEILSAVDAGTILNPNLALGQVHGAIHMGLGLTMSEENLFDAEGRPTKKGLMDYKTFRAGNMPKLETILIETYEPTGPYGAKAIAEIPVNGPAPAIGNALKFALGVRIRRIPFTPERILHALGKI